MLAAVVTLVFAASIPANACWCRDPGSACDRVGGYETVFVGQAVALKDDSRQLDENGEAEVFMGGSHRRFTFQVEERFQGTSGKSVVVSTGTGGGDCGYAFTIGKTYYLPMPGSIPSIAGHAEPLKLNLSGDVAGLELVLTLPGAVCEEGDPVPPPNVPVTPPPSRPNY